MPTFRRPVVAKKTTKGISQRVPCPHCNRPINFQGMAPAAEQGAGWGAYGLERGATVDCDHCGKKCKIVGVQQVTIISLQQEF